MVPPRRGLPNWFPVCALLALALVTPVRPGEATPRQPARIPVSDLFTHAPIPRLTLIIAPADVDRLREQPRTRVPVVIAEDDGRQFTGFEARLKGSTGSFRPIDDKPCFTLVADEDSPDAAFHDLTKFHLNNSVEDPAYFNELAGSELFRAAGVPAPRVAHALVRLNDRLLGLYVLKEGFTPEFLGRSFQDPHGNLYDTGTGHDVDEPLEKDAGDGPDDRRDLAWLAAAARDPDPARRWERLGTVLDLDRFLSFMAMEVIAWHRDGYCLARNNYRIYHDPGTGRMVFLPHGMDQLFGRPDAPLLPAMSGIVARAVIETPEGARQYRERLDRLLRDACDVPQLERMADALLVRLARVVDRREHREIRRALDDTRQRLVLRKRHLERLLGEPPPLALPPGESLRLAAGWEPRDAPDGGQLARRHAPDGSPALYVRAGPRTAASWRTAVTLARGRYRFTATAVARGIEPLPFGRSHGAGLRAVGASAPDVPHSLVGDHAAAALKCPFTLAADGRVELVCELRARAGEVWFPVHALRLEAIPP